MISIRFLVGFLAVLLVSVTRGEPQRAWIEDFAEAKERALDEDKPMLIVFAGSDWCRWCQRLESELLGKEAFVEVAVSHAVLLELDFPRRKKLPIRQQRANRKVFQMLSVESFPTVLLYDPKTETEYWRHGYRSVAVEEYLDWFKASF